MVLLTPDVSKGTESAAVKFSLLILSGVASIMCSARVIIFTCFIKKKKKKKTREESVYCLLYIKFERQPIMFYYGVVMQI